MNSRDVLRNQQQGGIPYVCLVRAAVHRPPQRSDTRGDAGVRVGFARARDADGARAGVLLVVGVQQENRVHRLAERRGHNVVLARCGELRKEEAEEAADQRMQTSDQDEHR